MTIWMGWPVWRRLAGIAVDQVSSSTTMAIQTAMELRSLGDAARSAQVDDPCVPVREGIEVVLQAHPTAAPIANLRNLIYDAPDLPLLLKTLDAEIERLGKVPARLAEHGAALIHDGESVLVHSLSSSVRAVLDRARQTCSFSVTCTVEEVSGEGRQMAAELAGAGYSIEMLSVSHAATYVAGVDLILVGADAIGPGRVINKEGTSQIARAGVDADVPRYVIAATDKILAEELFVTAASRAEAMDMDLVPLSWFSAVISERGPLTPGDVSRLATERRVAPELR
ncbi:MAG: hypothetical protein OEM40_05805 [Acidimicrobiia bacterium]|nr:hypothetical protein [Acidimicrobiia bacterium]MDH5503257.1 hypothetical protein [Acidimicrobiia bacterium]